MNIHSDAATCWICLEGGLARKGEPLVRDCACRGNDAGFAHASCIIKYAEKKCRGAQNRTEFSVAWEKCPNCKQCYQNDLANHLADVFVSFTKKTYGCPGNSIDDTMKVLESLRLQVETRKNTTMGKAAEKEIETLIHELLATVDQAKKEHYREGWENLAPTRSKKKFWYTEIAAVYESFGYYYLGYLCSSDDIDTEIRHYEKARDICSSVGSVGQAQLLTGQIEQARVRSQIDKAGRMKDGRKAYEDALIYFGPNSEHTIKAGISFVVRLRIAYCSIEAERLVTKLSATSRQVFGEDHKYTKQALELLNKIRRRFVFLGSPGSHGFTEVYEALRYENDGEMCIVIGPISDITQNKDEEGQELSVASEFIYPHRGFCPVTCHGLINASHLNGKLGDVRSVLPLTGSSGGFRFVVHFEDKSLKPAAVKSSNLRIAFELPSVQT